MKIILFELRGHNTLLRAKMAAESHLCWQRKAANKLSRYHTIDIHSSHVKSSKHANEIYVTAVTPDVVLPGSLRSRGVIREAIMAACCG